VIPGSGGVDLYGVEKLAGQHNHGSDLPIDVTGNPDTYEVTAGYVQVHPRNPGGAHV
jgi:hypothetical protein